MKYEEQISGFLNQKYLKFNETIPLVKYLPKIKESNKRNLLSDDIPMPEAKKTEEEVDDGKFYQYFKKELYLYLVYDNTAYQTADGGPPIQIRGSMNIDHKTNSFYPIIYLSDYWCLKKDLVMVNDTVPELNLTLHFNTYSLHYFIIQRQFEDQWKT